MGRVSAGSLLAAATLLGSLPGSVLAQYAGVASTLHNLSVSGPGEIKSQTETEVCKFCHVPHTASAPEPLWSRPVSAVPQYRVARIRRPGGVREPAPQPDGSSRLCLSCHDGTIALGRIADEGELVPMSGDQRLSPGRRGHLGTDLSGGHPISFVVPDAEPDPGDGTSDMGLRPRSAIEADGQVRLDKKGKMQCTTCHDPHEDRYYESGRVPRFWVKPTVSEVCWTCHRLR